MAFGDTVGAPAEANTGSSTTLTVNFGVATAGNLLVAVFVRSIAATWTTVPSNWNEGPQVTNATGNFSAKVFWKIAAGGETSVVGTTAAGGGNWRGVVAEFAGAFEASPLDQSNESEANIATAVTSQTSGTTGTTSQADELAIACFAAQVFSNADTSRAYSNSFTEVIAGGTSNAGRAGAYIAKRVLSATGTYSSTFSVTDTGDEMYGAILTFKKQGSSSTHDLTATGVSAGTPGVGSPALTQAQAITGTGVNTGSPSVASPALSVAHGLTAVGVDSGTPSVGSPALTVAYALTGTGIATDSPTIGASAATVAHGLTGNGVSTGTPVVGASAVSEAYTLTATGITTGTPIIGTPVLLYGDPPPPIHIVTIAAESRRVGVEGQSRIRRVAASSRVIVAAGE